MLLPCCKINIGLDILRKRADGYHDIETLMYPVRGLHDRLEFLRTEGNEAELTELGDPSGCPPQQNLVIKAYRLMRERYGIGGVKIRLHKTIPSGAGLGGGSSDAAHTITGLDTLFGLGLSDGEMEALAAELGSDVPFFIRNTPQLCTGRGEIMVPFPDILAGKYILIVKPDIHVSTAEAYAGVTPRIPEAGLAGRLALPPYEWRHNIENGFEKSLFKRHPQLALLKKSLYGCGAVYASMTGSGSALYGIFDESPYCISIAYGHSFLIRL